MDSSHTVSAQLVATDVPNISFRYVFRLIILVRVPTARRNPHKSKEYIFRASRRNFSRPGYGRRPKRCPRGMLACLWLGRVVLFDELVRETDAVDFFKIENLT